MSYTIQPNDDMRLISVNELDYYHGEAIPAERVRPTPDERIPRVLGAVVLMEDREGYMTKGGLVRVVINPERQRLGFSSGIEVTVLDLDRKPVTESMAIVNYEKGIESIWHAMGLNAIYEYRDLADKDTSQRSKFYTSTHGFFIREPSIIKRQYDIIHR